MNFSFYHYHYPYFGYFGDSKNICLERTNLFYKIRICVTSNIYKTRCCQQYIIMKGGLNREVQDSRIIIVNKNRTYKVLQKLIGIFSAD